MTKPPFDFPINVEDGFQFYPNENDTNLGYTWMADGGYWALIKQIPNPDVTKEYVDERIQILETEISNLTDIVLESVQVTASLQFRYVVTEQAVAAYKTGLDGCLLLDLTDGQTEEEKLLNCRETNYALWNGWAGAGDFSGEFFITQKGEFQTLESGGDYGTGSFSDVHVIDVCEQDLYGATTNWIVSSGETGAVKVDDYIQIVRMNGGVEDSSNYGYYRVRNGKRREDRGGDEVTEAEFSIGLDFQHGKGFLLKNQVYKIRGVRQTGALTSEAGDERYVSKKNAGHQTMVGELRVPTITANTNESAATTKKYVDDKQQSAVPIGSIIAFSGLASKIPEGWLLCGGESFSSGEFPGLKELFPNNTLPDFRGHFLVGYGADEYGTFLGKYEQTTALPKTPFKTNSYSHGHAVNDGVYMNKDNNTANNGSQVNYTSSGYNGGVPSSMATDINNHMHDINVGGDEYNRPNSYAVNWIIKAG